MKLLLCNDKKIKSYNLTNGNEDGLIIDYYDDSDIYETISIKKVDNSWSVENTVNIEIVDNKNICDLYEKKDIHFLSINKTVSLYIVPSIDNYIYYSTEGFQEIKIGNTNDCNIIFGMSETQEVFAKIKKEENKYIIESQSENNIIYIDDKAIKSKKLSLGNTIFINGLKIIWMDNFIMVSSYKDNLMVNGLNIYTPQAINETYNLPSEYERNIKLFSDNQVFFHSPRMQLVLEEETVKLDPPPEEDQDKYNRMPLFLTLGSSSIICITSCATGIATIRNMSTNNGDISGSIIELIICSLMIFISLAIPVMTNKWEKNREKNKDNLRRDKYTKYLDNKKQQVEKIIKSQSEILNDNNLTLEEIQKRIINGATIWPREIQDSDFLDIRIGIGDVKAKINVVAPSDHFFLYDDDLRDQAMEFANSKKMLTNVPITLSLVKNKIVSFIFDAEFKDDYINGIMMQLMYYYSPKDLKIVIFTDEDSSSNWDYMKYAPHIWSSKRDKRFFSENYNESIQLSSYLDQIYDKRITVVENDKKEKNEYEDKSKLYLNYDEYYLIVTDNFEEAKNVPIINRILDSNSNVGFSLVVFGNDLKKMPSKLDRFVYINNKNSAVYLKNLTNNDQSQFKAEYITNLDIENMSKQIANIPVDYKISGYNLPESISFMDMLHAGKLSHLNITKKWAENDPTTSLYAPVGIKDNGKLIGLDLHEKIHGPHGLIAGSTGSGKSEFIITFLLSLAINYNPNEVQFILIDYKGGGLAGAFENRAKGIKIPHLVGTITNLDTSEMNRTLVSIQSELKRRQQKFNEARELLNEGTIDIYKYQKMYREGKIKEPMSHLLVVCDEFAELKQQQPEFMSELISTSRIGRSLGVHLILATQKPSGVVDDQIWSNARFKVCLKVQTEVDSNEMLKRPDAAFIKETGRFYFQVGNNELFEYGQSAWSGAKYIPVEHVRNKIDDSVNFISNSGLVLKTVNEELKNNDAENNSQEQLVSIVNYLYELGKKEKYNFSSLWLPSLAKDIYMSELIKKYDYKAQRNIISPIIGEYDKPAKQEQGLYELNINSSNTVIFGIPNSGKESILSNIIYTSCLYHTPQAINIYIIDFGSGSLTPYLKFPHVGDIITVANKEKVQALYQYLDKEISRRKEAFAEFGGNYDSYIKNSGKTIPLLLTIINSFEAYMENCYNQDDYLNSLLREGSKYGIVFITSAISTSSIRSTILEYYATKIILQTNDKFDYYYILGAPNELLPKRNFGRGLARINDDVCEFQTAIIADDSILIDSIKKVGTYMQEYYKYKVPPIKILPERVTLNSMFKYAKQITKIPLGYTRDDVSLYYYNFIANKVTSIIGNNVTNDIRFMCSIIDLIDAINDVKINIFDFLTCIQTDGKAKYYSISFLDAFNEILLQQEQTPTINIIIGIGNIYDVLDNKEKEVFDEIISNIYKLNNQYVIIFDNNDRFSKVINESWFTNINRNYIWVGKYIDSQKIFDISNISNSDIDEKLEDMIYVIQDNNYYVIKGVGGSE